MIYDTKLADLIYDAPSGPDVAWENLPADDFSTVMSYYDNNDGSLYRDMNLEEQFMFLCFVILAEAE